MTTFLNGDPDSTPTAGQVAAYDATKAAFVPSTLDVAAVTGLTAALAAKADAAHERRGTGQPNGVVTATPGTYYTDEAGTAGAWLWLKTSGTGNTGWTAVYGHASRNVSSLLLTANGYTGGTLNLTRSGNMVTLTAISLTRSSAGVGYNRVLNLPIGFRATQPVYIRTLIGNAYGYALSGEVTLSGASTNESFSITFQTSDAWPATLPGT